MYAQTRTLPHEAILDQTVKQPSYQTSYTTNQLTDHLNNQSIRQSTMPLSMTGTFNVQANNSSTNQSTDMSSSQGASQLTFVARASSPLDPLEREQREIDRRRARLEDRRQRVLHAKTRLIGVDVNSLDEQVRAKQATNQSNLAMERMYDSMRVAHADQLTQLAYQQAINQSSERLALAFTHQQQASEKRAREQLSHEIHTSTPNVETTFLSFPGEDLQYSQRIAYQQKQQADWASRQIEEKLSNETEQRRADAEYERQQQVYLQLQREDDARRAAAVQQANAELAATNFQLSRSKQTEAARLSSIDASLKHAELVSTFNDRFMTENSFDRDGNRGYCFKGLTQAERQRILDEQRAQQQDLAQRRQREQEEKRQYDVMQDGFQRTLILNDISKRETEARERVVLKEERERQAREKAARDQYLNAVVYTNPVKEEYFAQFGTSAR